MNPVRNPQQLVELRELVEAYRVADEAFDRMLTDPEARVPSERDDLALKLTELVERLGRPWMPIFLEYLDRPGYEGIGMSCIRKCGLRGIEDQLLMRLASGSEAQRIAILGQLVDSGTQQLDSLRRAEFVKHATAALQSKSPALRLNAVCALCHLAGPEACPLIEPLLEDEDRLVRYQALCSYFRTASADKGVAAAMRRLIDPDEGVSYLAKELLEEGLPGAGDVLDRAGWEISPKVIEELNELVARGRPTPGA